MMYADVTARNISIPQDNIEGGIRVLQGVNNGTTNMQGFATCLEPKSVYRSLTSLSLGVNCPVLDFIVPREIEPHADDFRAESTALVCTSCRPKMEWLRMMRKTFTQEMQDIKDEVLRLGSMVENAIMESARSLRDNDLDRSRRVLKNDLNINRRRYEIEASIMILIATQQPIARDLRMLAASLDVCAELERIGDYGKGIATINLRSDGLSMPDVLSEIYSMAVNAVEMLHQALTTYANEDMSAARWVIEDDAEIDARYRHLYASAIGSVISDPRNIERANYIIWVAHNLERLGDRATNICERAIFIVTGERHLDASRVHSIEV